MIGTGIDVRVKIQDIVSSQLPEYIRNDSPLTSDFLKQFYISQEFQGGAVDFASNLDQYLELSNLTPEVVAGEFFLTQDISAEDTEIQVNSTKSFPNEWGLLKVDDEIITYTGVTTNSFTGVVRGFSGITSYRDPANPAELVFEQTEAAEHKAEAEVTNLSTLFLKEFYNKIKFTFAPGFENLDFDSDINTGNWIRQARSFYQTKGSEESFEILFRVLFGQDPTVIDLEQFLIKSSDAAYSRRDFAVGIEVQGNPIDLTGKTIFQSNDNSVFGAISEIEPFTRANRQYYRLYLFVSTDEIANERKLFTVPGRTKAQRAWSAGDTTVTVDSTLGFRQNNEFITSDGTVFKYEERTVNQFLGVTCEDPDATIKIDDEIIDDIYVYGFNDKGEEVRLRLTGTLSDISFEDDGVPFTSIGEKISVDSLGENIVPSGVKRTSQTYADIVANSFIYNTSVRFEVLDISGSTFSISAPYLDDSYINEGDFVDILERNTQNVVLGNRPVDSVDFLNATITISDTSGLPQFGLFDIRRRQNFATSSNTPIDYGNDAILTNVINLYDARNYDDNFYVATNSLPSYDINVEVIENIIVDINPSNLIDKEPFEDTYKTLVFSTPVPFFTGDLITYSVKDIGITTAVPICDTGEYFVEVLADSRQVRLFVSPSFIGSDNNVALEPNFETGEHIFTLSSQSTREIKTQRTYRKIPISAAGEQQNITINRTPAPTEPGTIAVLTNGVEILNYEGRSKVFLGPLKSIDPVAGGRGYSVTDPPEIVVADPDLKLVAPLEGAVASTAKATPVVRGKLEKILVDPQDFDVDKVFSISVVGGNSPGATAVPIIERRRRSVPFDSRTVVLGGGVDPNDESILFLQDHKFSRGEKVVYNNRGGESIGVARAGGTNSGASEVLANGGVYYCEPVNNRTIKLYPTIGDLSSGINTVGFTSALTGFGIQAFDTLSKNRITGATIIEDGGEYVYRKMNFKPSNVVIEYDEIRYDNHGFESGEIVEYGTSEVAVGGMSTEHRYYVEKIDDNRLMLADAGIGGTSRFDFDRKDFVNFTSTGVGTHFIKYPEIEVDIVVSFASTITGVITATPFIRGEIDSFYIDDGGFYGSDILNFEKAPEVEVKVGSGARLGVVVVEGEISSILILSRGRNYPSTPDIIVTDPEGGGQGAVLRAIVEDGEIVDVLILSPGVGYQQASTRLKVVDPAEGAIISPRIRDLTINIQSRFGFESLIDNNYAIVSYDRTIREGVYNDDGFSHSPIIGWANDGNPIYGGFGLNDPEDINSGFRAMKTAYELDPDNIVGRPSLTLYPAGFFIEDYVYTDNGDLDQYNGRYCRTPEFPNGVYAYFAGISTDVQSLERAPQFPYFIGPEYRDAPIRDRNGDVNQDFEINDKPIYRNTLPYAVGQPFIGSEFIDQSYLFDIQGATVGSVNEGRVKDIDIIGVGLSYSNGDVIVFDQTEDSISAIVSRVTGKEIKTLREETLVYTKDLVRIVKKDKDTAIIKVDPNHEYLDKDNIIFTGLSTSLDLLSGSKSISVDNRYMTLFSPMEDNFFPTYTDIFVNALTENISVGSSLVVGFGNTTEGVEILNIFPQNKALRVSRPLGLGVSFPIGTPVNVVTDRFEVKASLPDIDSRFDESYYFNPTQTVGFGTRGEDGNTYATVYSIGNINYNIDVPVRSIYAPNHGFVGVEPAYISVGDESDDRLAVDDGDLLQTQIPRNGVTEELIFVERLSKDYIGIRTSAAANNLFISGGGEDLPTYNIRTIRNSEGANIARIDAVVTTDEPHGLTNRDVISMNVVSNINSGIGTDDKVIVKFDEVSQTLIINPRSVNPSGIDTSANIITLASHGFKLGDYVLYTTLNNNPIAGIETHQKYFVVPFDLNRFQLAETFEDIRPGSELIVNLESAGIGTHVFSLVNPQIPVTANNNIVFDIEDPSLQEYELKFFYDQTLTEVFDANGVDDEFTVIGVGTAGFEGAEKIIEYSPNNPSSIYYGLEKGGYISTADTNTLDYSTITLVPSSYNISSRIVNVGLNTFSYSLLEKPESSEYIGGQTEVLEYNTSSSSALGGVADTRIISSGTNFANVPEFITIQSKFGNAATLRASSDDIGKLASFTIDNPGWGYSADNTLRPKGIVQSTIQFDDSDFVTGITITQTGNGYQNPPNYVLIDAVTREEVDGGAIEFEVQNSGISDVIIEVAPSGLSKNAHELITVNNSNGIPIDTVEIIDNVVGIVTFKVQTPIFGYNAPPFAVGDKVFVENIISELGEFANMNSEDYGYTFFEVVGVTTTNPIEVAVKYPEEARGNLGIAVTFQGAFSSMVNEKIYPKFQVDQATAIFIVGERLTVIDEKGKSIDTDLIVEQSNTNFFKVRGNYDILAGDRLKGSVSGITVTVTDVSGSECRFQVDSISRIARGWNTPTGFLNEEYQVTPDNDYYQNLSYSIKSEVTFEEMISPINRLVHPAGLKNFADVKLESSAGLGFTSQTGTSITIDLIGLTDVANTPLRVDRINNFDLGFDENVRNNITNAIRFNSKTPNKRLTDYFEVRTNRVLLHDDISNEFIDQDNVRSQKDYIDFNVVNSVYTRGVLQVRNPFTDQVELQEIITLNYNNDSFTMLKAFVSDNEGGYGTFEGVAQDSTEYTLRYQPFDIESFDFDAKLFTNRFIFEDESDYSIGNSRLGGTERAINPGNIAAVFTATAEETEAVALQATLVNEDGFTSYYEVYVFRTGNDTSIGVYGFNGDRFKNFNSDFVGEFEASVERISGDDLLVINYRNTTDQEILVTTKSTEFASIVFGSTPFRFKRPSIPNGTERSLILNSERVVAPGTDTKIKIGTYDAALFQSVRQLAFVRNNTFGMFQQNMYINSDGETFVNEYPFITEGNGSPGPGIGTFGAEIVGTDMELFFFPEPGLDGSAIRIAVYDEVFYRESDNLNYRNIPLVYGESEETYYIDRYIAPLGQRTNNVRFPLLYEGIPIYQKIINPADDLVGVGTQTTDVNVINATEHFFSTGELLYYEAGSSVKQVTPEPISIAATTLPGVGFTDQMPREVYAIKFDLNRFGVAGTFEDAILRKPLKITGIGSGNSHSFEMSQKLEKTVITIDGVLQSPIASSNKLYSLAENSPFDDTLMVMSGIGTIRVGDLLLINNDEYVRVDNVGFGTSNDGPINNTGSVPLVEVKRGVVGSAATDHLAGASMALYRGSYNIVDSDIIFTEAPSGKGAFSVNESNLVEFNSSFQGRTFLQKEYDQIAVYDDISDQFDGESSAFNITSAGSTTSEIDNGNGLLLINDIYQTPTTDNNEGNNFFYTYNPITGINSVVFTGITSENGEQIFSEFDVNQNQVPRGGLIVSLGSTPGLGYAPRYGASIQAGVGSQGQITGIVTENVIGVTTDIVFADYDNESGEMVVSALGAPETAPISIGIATYQNISGQLLIQSTVSLSSIDLKEDDIVVLDGLEFDCAGLSTAALEIQNAPYDHVTGIVTITTIDRHNTEIGERIVLNGLEYSCDSYQANAIDVTNAPYDNATGLVTVTTAAPHTLALGDKVGLRGLEYECSGTSLETLNVTNVIYDKLTGITTVTLDGSHNTDSGARIQLSGIEFDCDGESLRTLDVTSAPYDSTTGIATVTFFGNHLSEVGDRVQLTGLEYECNGTSEVTYGVIDAPYTSTSGIATIQLNAPHGQIVGSRVQLSGLEYDCNGTSLSTLNVFRVDYENTTGITTIRFLGLHNTEVGERIQLSGLEFDCTDSLDVYSVNFADYNNETGDLKLFVSAFDINSSLQVGDVLRMEGLNFQCAANGGGIETYPEKPNREYVIQSTNGNSEITVNVGVSTRSVDIIDVQFDSASGLTTVRLDGIDPSVVNGEQVVIEDLVVTGDFSGSIGTYIMNIDASGPQQEFTLNFDPTIKESNVYDATYDNTTGVTTVYLQGTTNISVGSSIILSSIDWNIGLGTTSFPAQRTTYEVQNVTGVGNTVITINTGIGTTALSYESGGGVTSGITEVEFVSGNVIVGYEENAYVFDADARVRVGYTTSIYPTGVNGYEFEVLDVPTSTTLVVNTGINSFTHEHVTSTGIATVGFTTTVYPDGTNGFEFEILDVPTPDQLTINVGSLPGVEHTYVSGGIATVGFTTNIFPDGTNGYEFVITGTPTPNTLEVNVGAIPGIDHVYVGSGIGTVGFTTDFFPDGTNGYEFEILETPSLNTVVINTGANPFGHTYVAGGIGTVGFTTNIFPDGTNGYQFNVLNVIDPSTFVVNVGPIPGIEHTYVGSGTAFVGFTTTLFPDGTNGYEFEVLDVLDSNVLAVNVGPSPFEHEYVQGGEMTVGFNTSIFPDKDPVFTVVSVINDDIFSIDVGPIIRIPHTYLGGGTFQKYAPFEFGVEGQNPNFVYLNRIEFSCPTPQGGGYNRTLEVLDAPYDEVTGIVTVKTREQHKRLPGNPVQLRNLRYECAGTSETALNVTNVVYDDQTGLAAVTFDTNHNTQIGYFVELGGIEFDCSGTSLTTLNVLDAPYDNTTGIVTVLFDDDHGTVPGARVQLTGLGYTCNNNSLIPNSVITANFSNLSGELVILLNDDHGYNLGQKVRLEDLQFSSTDPSFPGISTFPTNGDYTITDIPSLDSFAINVGGSVFDYTYESGGTVYSGITSTIFPSGNNGYEFEILSTPTDDSVTIGVGTLPFGQEYVQGGIGTVGFTTSIFPDGTNGYRFEILNIPTPNQVVVNVGAIAGIQHTYVQGGIGTVGITTNVFPDGTNGYEFPILNVLDSFTLELNVGAVPGINHNYVGGGSLQVGLNTDFFPDVAESFPFVFLDDHAHFRVLVGESEFEHTYVSGGTIGQYSKNNVGSGYNTRRVSIGITEEGHTGVEAEIEAITGPGGELVAFDIINPGTGYTNPYVWAPDPEFSNLPTTGVFRRSVGPNPGPDEQGKNLFITCEVGAAKTTAIGRSEFFEVENFELSNQGYGFQPGDIVEVVGLVTDKRLSQPIEPFQVTILETFTDNISLWTFGELNYIDNIKRLQDGSRTRFPLVYNGELIAFEQNPDDEESAAIDMDSLLLIFVNTVLQVPGLNYTFGGGTTFEFARAPFPEDDIDIYFYKGKENIDSREVLEVDESIRPGDELQLKKNDRFIEKTKTQDIRTVTELVASDTARTNLYFGNDDLETLRERETAWDKQKRDVFIYGEIAPKTRDSYEPIIRPNSSIIATVEKPNANIGVKTTIYLDSAFLFEYEEKAFDTPTVLTGIEARMYRKQVAITTAVLEAQIDQSGALVSVITREQGAGYPVDLAGVSIYVDPPPGVSAPRDDPRRAQLLVFNNGQGGIATATPLNVGIGYNPDRPPLITVVEPPISAGDGALDTGDYEDIDNIGTIEGFSGIITGIQRTAGSKPSIGNGIRFFYKTDGQQGDLNALKAGDYLVVNNTSVGNGIQAVDGSITNRVGFGTQFLDCVYRVVSHIPFSFVGEFEVDIGANPGPIESTGENLGYFSWGKMNEVTRDPATAISIEVGNLQYTPDMENYPSIIRTAEGLRNEGGIAKKG